MDLKTGLKETGKRITGFTWKSGFAAMLVGVAVMVGTSSIPAAASESLKYTGSDGLSYDYYETTTDDGEQVVGISAVYGTGDSLRVVHVPETINGKKVYEIGDVFRYANTLEEVYLPESVKIIDGSEFLSCTALRKVNLGGTENFMDIPHLGWLFDECQHLESFSTGDTSRLSLSENTAIGREFLQAGWHKQLKYIYLGNNITDVSPKFFYGPNLEWIEIGPKNPVYCSINGVLYTADRKQLIVCGTAYQGSEYEIPDGVEEIGIGFDGCSNIRKIKIPSSVRKIYDRSSLGTDNVTLLVEKYSYAHMFATENNIPVEFYGKPQKTEHTVCFKGGEGAHGSAPESLSAVEGETVTLPKNPFTNGYKTFLGWSDGSSLYQPGNKYSMPDRDVTFTAVWQEHTHTYRTVTDKKATCAAAGSRHKECTVCGEKEAAEAVPATGKHSFGAYKVTKAPTALEKGRKTRSCSVCGTSESIAVAKRKATAKLSASKLTLKAGQSTTKLTVSGLAVGDYVKSWKSGNTKIVKVGKKGKLTAQKKTGSTTVTVTLASGLKKSIKVTVQKGAVKTSKISGLPKKLTLKKGGKTTLKPTVTPITSQDKVTYKSADKKIATVSAKGVVTAKKVGKTKITVTSGKKKLTVTVTVKKK